MLAEFRLWLARKLIGDLPVVANVDIAGSVSIRESVPCVIHWKSGAAMSKETLEFIAREISKVLPKGKKRRVWLKEHDGEVVAVSRL